MNANSILVLFILLIGNKYTMRFKTYIQKALDRSEMNYSVKWKEGK